MLPNGPAQPPAGHGARHFGPRARAAQGAPHLASRQAAAAVHLGFGWGTLLLVTCPLAACGRPGLTCRASVLPTCYSNPAG